MGGSDLRVNLPAARWAVVAGQARLRFYATAAIPTGLYRITAPSDVLTLNFGALSRLTWLDREGHEGLVGLEAGALGIGLAATPGFPRTLALLGGIGLAVPIGNRGETSQASVNFHAWLAYELRDTYVYNPDPNHKSLVRTAATGRSCSVPASPSATSGRTCEWRARGQARAGVPAIDPLDEGPLASPEVHALLLIFASRLWIEAMRTWAAAEPPPAPARSPDDVILYLVPSRPNGVDARALADAVVLYTRDLRLTIKILPNETPLAGPAENEHLAAIVRSWRARFAFWCVPSPDGRTVGLYSIDARGIDRQDVVDVTGLEGPDLDRAVALKVRSMLPLPPRVPEPAPAPATTTTPPPSRATERLPERGASGAAAVPAVGASVSGPAAAGAAVIVEPATETPATSHLAAALEYCLSTGPAAASPRQSLALSAIGDFPRPERPAKPERRESVEIFTTVEVSLPVNRSVSLYDLPLRVGGRFMFGAGRFVAGVGLFGTAHLLWASASTDGSEAHTFALAGGGGLEVLARGRLAGRLSWQVRPWAEIIVPRTVFLVEGTSVRETGKYAAGLGLGLAAGGW